MLTLSNNQKEWVNTHSTHEPCLRGNLAQNRPTMQLSPPQPPAFHSVTGDIADQGIDTITVSKLAFNPLTPNLGGREERSGDTPDPGRDESLHSPDPRLIFTPTLPKGDSRGILRDTLILRRVYDQTPGPPQADHSRGAKHLLTFPGSPGLSCASPFSAPSPPGSWAGLP
jgi:hypothetical protein